MALILNIETATEVCSVGISKDKSLLSLKESQEPYIHAKSIITMINQCAEDANIQLKDLDAVAVSSGPGSYTALRVGTSTAKGICYALDKPLITIDTLQAIAHATYEKEKDGEALYCPMIDARRMEVYSILYNAENKAVTKLEPRVVNELSYKDYFASNKKLIFSGNGAEKCKTVITSELAHFSPIVCSAAHLVPLSQKSYLEQNFSDLAYFTPNYLKSPNITTPKPRAF